MKNVVKKLPDSDLIPLTKVSPNKYYGAFLSREGDPTKGYFRAERHDDRYNLFALNGFNSGNAFGYESRTLMEAIEKVLTKSQDARVYEFDTLTELFTWMEN